ncbi:hypothetical protein GGS23DRAFT_597360 [Durotheca rogersii]|uniref:uncharacterized protein n=1 Tax=Durotheca rogersii TaxID=419775 RepID=UPI002220759F|nr:uncharacterized protein GGS23DRAFT_597360 [Durotheca rogersii]KAI5862560.1 hypothetical protein GGS23DRAFT_597360 [Durotheca rogersii]
MQDHAPTAPNEHPLAQGEDAIEHNSTREDHALTESAENTRKDDTESTQGDENNFTQPDENEPVRVLDKALIMNNKDGGEKQQWTAPIFGYLRTQDFHVSSPSAEAARSLKNPSSESITIALVMYHNPEDFDALYYKLLVRDLALDDENIGSIHIWADDITAITVDVVPDTEAVSELGRFSPALAKVDTGVARFTVTAQTAELSLPFAIHTKLWDADIQGEGRQIAARLRNLRTVFQVAKEQRKLTFQFYVSEDNVCELQNWQASLVAAKAAQAAVSPLAKYFQHSPNARVFHVGHCPVPNGPGFPSNVRGRRLVHFANADQHILYNVAGTYYDACLRFQAVHDLPSTEFHGHLLPLPHVQMQRRIVCLIDPRGKEDLLPKIGEMCKMHFPEAKPVTASTDRVTDTQFEDIAHEIHGGVERLQGEAGFATAMKASVGMYFRDQQVFDGPINDLLPTRDEVSAHRDDLISPATAQNGPDDDSAWSACRIDFASPYLAPYWQTYLLWVPTDKGADGEPVPRQIEYKHAQMPTKEQAASDYFAQCTDPMSNRQVVRVKRVASDKTLRAQVGAVSALKHPSSAQPPPSERSVAAYRYLVNFDSRAPRVNLLADLPGLGAVVKPEGATAPHFLRKAFLEMNRPMREAFEIMGNLPAGVCFVPGVAGCGKTYMGEMAMLFSQYGASGQDKGPRDVEPAGLQVLYLVDNNEGVENFVTRHRKTQERLGITHALPVVRLYPMDGEIEAGGKDKAPQGDSTKIFDEEAAAAECEAIEDHFLAVYAIHKMSLEINTRRARRLNQDSSLHSHALAFFEEKRSNYTELGELLGRVQGSQELSAADKSMLKSCIKVLCCDFLRQFKGTIVTTPVGASVRMFRENFKPALVILDEAATMHELTTLIAIAFFAPLAWLLLGDIQQRPPFVTAEHNLDSGQTSSNPFVDQYGMSTLERAVLAGETMAYLRVNNRGHGNSLAVANSVAYNTIMIYGVRVLWVKPLDDMAQHFQESISKDIPSKQTSILVEFPKAYVTNVGTSRTNILHRAWVLDQVKRLMDSTLTGLGKNDGCPVSVMLIALYAAQVTEYRQSIRTMIDCKELSESAIRDRVVVKTLDSAQGAEADIVFVDFVNVTHPGFTGAQWRTGLSSTRARGMTITLLNRGSFVGRGDPDNTANPLAQVAYELFKLFNSHRANCRLRLRDVDAPKDTTNHLCQRGCQKIDKRDANHPTAHCPFQICRNCKLHGHNATACERDFICPRCGRSGHAGLGCPATANTMSAFYCLNCDQPGHRTENCKQFPKDCKGIGYGICRNCSEIGHRSANCPRQTCKRCGEEGHRQAQCPTPFCVRCKETGHTLGSCKNAPPKCAKCGFPHRTQDCTGSTKKSLRARFPSWFVPESPA